MQASPAQPAPLRGRLVHAAYWILPSLFFLVLHRSGLRTFYFRDDFAWLGLAAGVHDLSSLLKALFQPLAQGSIRPISERLFFLAGWNLFGFDTLPMRIIVFATAVACLVLLSAVMRRMTGSATAAFLAPVFWVANANVYLPLTWTSAYNQILCALTLLLALFFFVRYTQTGVRRDYVLQWAVFLFGFGVLELTAVYPAIALLYALCCARRHCKSTLPMFAVSAVYAVVHRALAPPLTNDMYRMYFDASLLSSLWTYMEWSTGATNYAMHRELAYEPFLAAQSAVLAALAVGTAVLVYRRRWLALFFAGWFFLVLAPMLPLRNHVTHYYLTIPSIGLAMLGAWGVALALRTRRVLIAAPVMLLALAYLLPSAWAVRGMSRDYSVMSRRVRTFLGSLATAHRLNAGKPLLIRNVDSELFWSGWRDNPFPLLGIDRIYLASDSVKLIDNKPWSGLERWILPDRLAAEALVSRQIAVYGVLDGGRLRNETAVHRGAVPLLRRSSLPASAQPGEPLDAPLLGDGWYGADQNARWMSKSAIVRLRGPLSNPGTLALQGVCPAAMEVSVDVEGQPLGSRHLDAGSFQLELPLPETSVGKAAIEIRITVNRTVRVGADERQLGLAFGSLTVRP